MIHHYKLIIAGIIVLSLAIRWVRNNLCWDNRKIQGKCIDLPCDYHRLTGPVVAHVVADQVQSGIPDRSKKPVTARPTEGRLQAELRKEQDKSLAVFRIERGGRLG